MRTIKWILFFVAALAAVMIFFSCQKEKNEPNPSNPGNGNTEETVRVKITCIQEDETDIFDSRIQGQISTYSNYDSDSYFYLQYGGNGPILHTGQVALDTSYTFSELSKGYTKEFGLSFSCENQLNEQTGDILKLEVFYKGELIHQEETNYIEYGVTLE